MSDDQRLIVVLKKHSFDVKPSGGSDLETQARALLDGPGVMERRKDGGLTLHPTRRIKAIHVGSPPEPGNATVQRTPLL